MEFSLRDDQRGQGLIEYLLVLVIAVGLILGGVYQLNTAFKNWAENYFGDYLSCLLETGDLPSIGGTPGDSGICNQLFKEFSLAEGRPIIPQDGTPSDSSQKGSGAGTREGSGSASGRSGGSGGGSSYSGRPFTGSSMQSSRGGGRSNRMRGSSDSTYTGSTDSADYGNNLGTTNRRLSTKTKDRLDTQFAFDETANKQKRRGISSTSTMKPKEDDAAKKARREQKRREIAAAKSAEADTSFTIGDFIRYLIIAAIILAIVVFVGGQMLQIGKTDNG